MRTYYFVANQYDEVIALATTKSIADSIIADELVDHPDYQLRVITARENSKMYSECIHNMSNPKTRRKLAR